MPATPRSRRRYRQRSVTIRTRVSPIQSTRIHVVYLSGQVSDVKMSKTAEAIAKTIKGVTRVENNIAVPQ